MRTTQPSYARGELCTIRAAPRPAATARLPWDASPRVAMARVKGLEPSTSSVTGWRSNQLSYTPAKRPIARPFQERGILAGGAPRAASPDRLAGWPGAAGRLAVSLPGRPSQLSAQLRRTPWIPGRRPPDAIAARAARLRAVPAGAGGWPRRACSPCSPARRGPQGPGAPQRGRPGGGPGNAQSTSSQPSGDGQFVMFTTQATNLGPVMPLGPSQVCLRATAGGPVELVSAAPDRHGGQRRGSSQSCLSSDGRWVGFVSTATNLGPGDGPESVGVPARPADGHDDAGVGGRRRA